jgi:preprotein translocase subunit SecG
MGLILSLVIIAASALLIMVVYIQNSKGGGLSSEFGSPTQLGGVQKTTEFIEKLTWSLAGIIVAASIITTISMEKPTIEPETTNQNTEQQSTSPNQSTETN